MTHDLKILPQYYNDIINKNKNFEIRKNDRNFKVEDVLIIREFDDGDYTGRYIKAIVKYVFHGGEYGLEKGYCILSIVTYEYGTE